MEALDQRMSFSMLVQGLGNRLKGIMAKTLSPEEKFGMIKQEMKKDVEQKRLTARSIRAKMVALSDPDTAELEPMERLDAQRKKLVAAGAELMKQKEQLGEEKPDIAKSCLEKMNRIAQDIKALDSQLTSMHATYDTLKEAYEVSIENLRTAQAALDHVENNGEGLMFAIRAHEDALKVRDNARNSKTCDASFLKDMEKELGTAKATLNSDKEIDRVLNADKINVDDMPDDHSDVFSEFKAAQK